MVHGASFLFISIYICASLPDLAIMSLLSAAHPERSLLAHALAQWHRKCRKSRYAETKLQGPGGQGWVQICPPKWGEQENTMPNSSKFCDHYHKLG